MPDVMVYVAADPAQPGAAWAAVVDDPAHREQMKAVLSQSLSDWILQGAIVERVTVKRAREMLGKWERPEERG